MSISDCGFQRKVRPDAFCFPSIASLPEIRHRGVAKTVVFATPKVNKTANSVSVLNPAFMPSEAIANIISKTYRMERFWRCAGGWAPKEASDLLALARLDLQTSFACTLYDYLEPFPSDQAEARQILGYASLRSLCEGVLKLFFVVYLDDYQRDETSIRDEHGNLIFPDKVTFDRLIAFYLKKIDTKHETFLRRVQTRGNAIHHFNDRDIGNQDELIDDIVQFNEFLDSVDGLLPYP